MLCCAFNLPLNTLQKVKKMNRKTLTEICPNVASSTQLQASIFSYVCDMNVLFLCKPWNFKRKSWEKWLRGVKVLPHFCSIRSLKPKRHSSRQIETLVCWCRRDQDQTRPILCLNTLVLVLMRFQKRGKLVLVNHHYYYYAPFFKCNQDDASISKWVTMYICSPLFPLCSPWSEGALSSSPILDFCSTIHAGGRVSLIAALCFGLGLSLASVLRRFALVLVSVQAALTTSLLPGGRVVVMKLSWLAN